MLNWHSMEKWKSYSITDKSAVIASIMHGESQASVSCGNSVRDLWVIAKCVEPLVLSVEGVIVDIRTSERGLQPLNLYVVIMKWFYSWIILFVGEFTISLVHGASMLDSSFVWKL